MATLNKTVESDALWGFFVFVFVLILKFWDSILQGRMGEGEPDMRQHSGGSAPSLSKKKEIAGCLYEMTSRQKIACLSLGIYFVISTVRCQLKPILPTIRKCYWIETVDVEGALSRIHFERANRESLKSQRVNILHHWVGTSSNRVLIRRGICKYQVYRELTSSWQCH